MNIQQQQLHFPNLSARRRNLVVGFDVALVQRTVLPVASKHDQTHQTTKTQHNLLARENHVAGPAATAAAALDTEMNQRKQQHRNGREMRIEENKELEQHEEGEEQKEQIEEEEKVEEEQQKEVEEEQERRRGSSMGKKSR